MIWFTRELVRENSKEKKDSGDAERGAAKRIPIEQGSGECDAAEEAYAGRESAAPEAAKTDECNNIEKLERVIADLKQKNEALERAAEYLNRENGELKSMISEMEQAGKGDAEKNGVEMEPIMLQRPNNPSRITDDKGSGSGSVRNETDDAGNGRQREDEEPKSIIDDLLLADESERGVFKAEMEARVLRLEKNLTGTLDSFRTQLGDYRDALEKMMYDTRREIYKADFGTLAREFQKLYDCVVNDLAQRIGNGGWEIEPLYNRLSRRVRGLFGGLQKAGLTPILPKKDDLYDPNEHVAANAQDVDDDMDIPIISAVYPGFKKDDVVICRAAVDLDLSNVDLNREE